MSEQIRTTLSEEQEKEIERLAGEFRMKGMSDEDAQNKAIETVKVEDDKAIQMYADFIRKVKGDEFIDDLIRRALIGYRESYNKGKEIQEHIDFKLHRVSVTPKNPKNKTLGIAIAAAELRLEIKRNGVWTIYSAKNIQFTHKQQLQNKSDWNFVLYESMFQGLLFNGITHMIMTHDARNESTPESGEPTTIGGESGQTVQRPLDEQSN